MQQFRRLTVLIAVAAFLGSCAVHESTRGGGLVPPTGPPVPASASTPTVVTVAPPLLTAAVAPPADTASATTRALATTGVPVTTRALATVGTSATTPPPATTRVPATTRASATTGADPLASVRRVLAAATPLDGFREGVLAVSGPTGVQLWPVIIADTPYARQRGLMGVTDFAALGGYAAMVFIFDRDTSGAFWMRDTPLPLRITFVTAGGSVVSGTDMLPCLAPTPSGDCERYHPDASYRFAVEHPIGPAFDIGLTDAELVEVTVE